MGERTIKTQPKAQSYIIKRPRLTKLLDESGARIILLCAPAGYGKTTLAREWTEAQIERVAWYSAGPSICDVAAFACDLAELFASKRPESDVIQNVRLLAARQEPGHLLAKALAPGSPSNNSLVVIDDYHHAVESHEADSLLRELARIASFRLVLTSRTRPAWITSRMLVYGEALVLGPAALAFTDDEAREVLSDNETAGNSYEVL